MTGLSNNTEYKFAVGLYNSGYGGSELSTEFAVTTTNGKIFDYWILFIKKIEYLDLYKCLLT